MKFKNLKLQNVTITPSLARIHAHICGDGYIGISTSKRSEKELRAHPRKKIIRTRHYVRYVNMEETLRKQFVWDAYTTFKRRAVLLRKFEIEIAGKWIYDILVYLGVNKSSDWFVHGKILQSNTKCKSEWLKALFDDEGYIAHSEKHLEMTLVNKNALVQVQKLLQDFSIKSKLYGPYLQKTPKSKPCYRIAIRDENVMRYANHIGFNHEKKKDKLLKIVKKMGPLGHSD